jgi:uncharacterized damage-inducible protein DinB
MDENSQLSLIPAVWLTNNRVTEFFFENLPTELWDLKIPGAPRRTIRMIAGHLHNSRCMWIKMVGKQYSVKAPRTVNRRLVNRTELLRALKRSNEGILGLLSAAIKHDGVLKIKVPYANIPDDVVHFMVYLAAHEAHHRGQIVVIARELGHRLPTNMTSGLWQWKRWHQESSKRRVRA